MFTIDDPAPDFDLEAYHNDEIKRIKLSDLKGKWVVLFFYPGDFTFVCPTELGELAANYKELQEMGVEILGISSDSVFVHKAWYDASKTIKDIKFPLLADPTTSVCRNYGVFIDGVGEARRATFVIDPDGIVKSFEINHNSIGRNSAELVRKLQAAQFVREHGAEVCPASWKPGENTLKPGLDLVGKI